MEGLPEGPYLRGWGTHGDLPRAGGGVGCELFAGSAGITQAFRDRALAMRDPVDVNDLLTLETLGVNGLQCLGGPGLDFVIDHPSYFVCVPCPDFVFAVPKSGGEPRLVFDRRAQNSSERRGRPAEPLLKSDWFLWLRTGARKLWGMHFVPTVARFYPPYPPILQLFVSIGALTAAVVVSRLARGGGGI